MPYRGSLLGGFGFVVVRLGLGFGFVVVRLGLGFGFAVVARFGVVVAVVVGATFTGADVTGADVCSTGRDGGGSSSSHALVMVPQRPQIMNAMIPIPQALAFLRPTWMRASLYRWGVGGWTRRSGGM